MTAKTIFASVLFLLLPASQALAQAAPAKSSTVTAPIPAPNDRARQWLTLVDDGNYAQSWSEAGAGFKARSSSANWAKEAAAEREPLGAVASRDLKDVDLSHPQTAVVRYDSSFAHKTGAVETITLAFEKGAWSVTSYSVK
jgi:Protein of unknown function (DUF4019)